MDYRSIWRKKPLNERKSWSISTNVPYDIYKFIKNKAARKNISMAELLRIIIQDYYDDLTDRDSESVERHK